MSFSLGEQRVYKICRGELERVKGGECGTGVAINRVGGEGKLRNK